jgi:hypothetical protein
VVLLLLSRLSTGTAVVSRCDNLLSRPPDEIDFPVVNHQRDEWPGRAVNKYRRLRTEPVVNEQVHEPDDDDDDDDDDGDDDGGDVDSGNRRGDREGGDGAQGDESDTDDEDDDGDVDSGNSRSDIHGDDSDGAQGDEHDGDENDTDDEVDGDDECNADEHDGKATIANQWHRVVHGQFYTLDAYGVERDECVEPDDRSEQRPRSIVVLVTLEVPKLTTMRV